MWQELNVAVLRDGEKLETLKEAASSCGKLQF